MIRQPTPLDHLVGVGEVRLGMTSCAGVARPTARSAARRAAMLQASRGSGKE